MKPPENMTYPFFLRRLAMCVLIAIAVLLSLLSLPYVLIMVGMGSLHPLTYFICWITALAGAWLLFAGCATHRRRLRHAALLLILGAVSVIAGINFHRWVTHDRFLLPDKGYAWWKQEPFDANNGLPDHRAPDEFRFRDNLPCLAAAYALYPIASASVQALCPRALYDEQSGTNFIRADGSDVIFSMLDNEYVDAIFALKPSAEQVAEAEKLGVKYVFTPIARDAFVFFVNAQNPVRGLTSDQLRAIYSGRVTTWEELGVPLRAPLQAFQRNKNSGSQTTMERFMGDVPLATPPQDDVIDAMGGIIRDVADYRNHLGAIGYTFRYYALELVRDKRIRLLEVDGVAPTPDAIRSGAYPLVGDAYLITRGKPTGEVARLAAYLASPDGRALVEEIGYIAPEAHHPLVSGTAAPSPARGNAVRFTEQTGLMGLRWLKAVQNEDGSWPENKIAMTAMALCAYMAEGHRPGDSPEFSETMVKGANFIISHQQEDGLFDIRDPENFSHPIATWALFSLYGMTLNPNVCDAAEKALIPILKSQSETGGWAPAMARQGDDDPAYTFWCLEALRAAESTDIPRFREDLDDAIARATKAFDRLDHLQADTWTPSWDGPTPTLRPSKASIQPVRLSSDTAPFATQFDQFRVERILWEAYGEPYIKWIRPAVALYAAAQFVTPSNETASALCPCRGWNPNGPCSRLSVPYRDEEGTPRAIGHWINDDPFGDSPVMDTCLVLMQICKPTRYLPKLSKPKTQAIPPETEDGRDIAVDTDL